MARNGRSRWTQWTLDNQTHPTHVNARKIIEKEEKIGKHKKTATQTLGKKIFVDLKMVSGNKNVYRLICNLFTLAKLTLKILF